MHRWRVYQRKSGVNTQSKGTFGELWVFQLVLVARIMDICAPMSTRKRIPVVWSCKAPERLKDGARVLGLPIQDNGRTLEWKWSSNVPELRPIITRKAAFSMCGKLVGYFPLYGCLHVTASFMKRHVTTVTSGWDNDTQDAPLKEMMTDVMGRVHQWPNARKVVCERDRTCRMSGRKLAGS